jgi:uncharacterized DUF497 family protein
MHVTFEWDPRKAAENRRKHGVSFHEAATVFGDPLALSFPDPDHSMNEQRFITFGLSSARRHLVVAHVDRGENLRIISARKMTLREGEQYEEK